MDIENIKLKIPVFRDLQETKDYIFKQSGALAFIFATRYGLPIEYFQEEWRKKTVLELLFLINSHYDELQALPVA